MERTEQKKRKKSHALLRALIWILLVLFLGFAGYTYCYAVFADEPASSASNGQNVTVQITDGMSDLQVGRLLKKNGLVDNAFVFLGQTKVFMDDGASIQPGVYVLDTSMNAEEILEILAAGEESQTDTSRNSQEGET